MATSLDLQEQEQLDALKAFWNQYGNLITWVLVLALAAGLGILTVAALAVDLPVSQWMHTRQGLKGLHQPLQVIEALGDSTGVAIIIITPTARTLSCVRTSVENASIAAHSADSKAWVGSTIASTAQSSGIGSPRPS